MEERSERDAMRFANLHGRAVYGRRIALGDAGSYKRPSHLRPSLSRRLVNRNPCVPLAQLRGMAREVMPGRVAVIGRAHAPAVARGH